MTYEYACTIKGWVDGDTVDVVIDLGFHIALAERVRVAGINSPEVHSKSPVEKSKGLAALDYAEHLAPAGSVLKIQTAKATKETEKFGRWLASIALADGRDFGAVMIHDGFAVPYGGGPREKT